MTLTSSIHSLRVPSIDAIVSCRFSLHFFQAVLRRMLNRVKVFYLILQGENEVGKPVDIILCLFDGIFFQLFVKADHFVMLFLDLAASDIETTSC